MRIPRNLGRYEVLFPIASGGMADVFCARMSGVGGFTRLVALKRVRTDQREDADAVTAILDEARLASQIGSAHVVDVLDVGRGRDGSPYLVMELVVGVTLSDILMGLAEEESRLHAPLAVDILAQLATGLDDAHRTRGYDGEPLQIVHRDVSPQNALVGVDGVARLTDFGIARFTQRMKDRTARGEIRGKAGYLPPEVVKGAEATALSDQFSLAVVGWELLATERLFKGANALLTMKRVASMKAPRLDEIRGDLPEGIASVIARGLQKDPARRFESVGAMADALRRAAEDAAFAPVGRDELGEMARRYGGETMGKLERGIRVAAGQAPTDIIQLAPSRETNTTVLPAPESPESEAPPPLARRARRSSIALVAIPLVSLSAGLAVGTWWFTRAPAAPASNVAAPPAALTSAAPPEPSAPPPPEPLEPPPPPPAVDLGPTAAPIEPAAPPPAPEPVVDLEPMAAPPPLEAPPDPPPPPPEPEIEPDPPPPAVTRRRRRRRRPPDDEGTDPAVGVGGLLGRDAFR